MKDLWASDRLAEMQLRLARVGATDAELEEFADQWVNDDTWDADEKQRLWALGDPKLAIELMDSRALDRSEHETEDEEDEREQTEAVDADEQARIAELDDDAATAAEGNIGSVLLWVGDDLERAQASLAHEQACAEPRKGLVTKLTRILDTE